MTEKQKHVNDRPCADGGPVLRRRRKKQLGECNYRVSIARRRRRKAARVSVNVARGVAVSCVLFCRSVQNKKKTPINPKNPKKRENRSGKLSFWRGRSRADALWCRVRRVRPRARAGNAQRIFTHNWYGGNDATTSYSFHRIEKKKKHCVTTRRA